LKTIRLFEAYFKKRPDGHIVFFSTGGTIYRERSERTPFSEIDCTDPRSSYSNQKLMIENLLKLMCEEKGLSGTVLRVSNPYGVRLDAKRNQGLIGVATSCALNGQEFSLFGNPDLVRDYIHLDDLCSAVERVLDAKICKSGFQLYNVGSGEGHTTQEVLSLINCFSPKPLKIKMQDANSIEPQWNILDTTKFRNTYSWSPIKSLEEGIRELFL
jgi:UDP-glucose 4-epimerase